MSKAFREYLKNRERESSNALSSSNANHNAMMSYVESKRNSYDTLADDEVAARKILNDTYSNWQNADVMANNRKTVENMYNRLSSYSQYGGLTGDNLNNIKELTQRYKTALDNWDSMTNYYGQFKNANAYTVQKQQNEWADKNKGLSYGEVKDRLKTAKGAEKDYLSQYGVIAGYNTLEDYDAELADKRLYKKTFADKFLTSPNEMTADKEEKDTYYSNLSNARNLYEMEHVFDKYSSLENNADFTKNISTYTPGAEYNLDDGSGMYRNVYTETYDKMSMEEQNVADYIGNTRGDKAYGEYMTAMKNRVDRRAYENMQQKMSEWATDNLFNKALFSALSVPANLLAEVATLPEEIVGGLEYAFTGENNFYSPYSGMAQFNTLINGTRQAVGNSFDWNIGKFNAGNFLYQTGMSIADSALGIRALKGVGTALGVANGVADIDAFSGNFARGLSVFMGSGAFNTAYKNSIERGIPEGDALLVGLADGVNEVLFEEISIDRLLKMSSSTAKTYVLKALLEQGMVEGSEEVATDIANLISEYTILGNNQELVAQTNALKQYGYSDSEIKAEFAKQIASTLAQSLAGGFLSGAALGSTAGVRSYVTNSRVGSNVDATKLGNNIASLGENSDVYKDYLTKTEKYGNDFAKAGSDRNAILGDLSIRASAEASQSEGRAVIQQYLINEGMSSEEAAEVTEALLADKKTAEQKKLIKGIDVKGISKAVEDYYASPMDVEAGEELTKARTNRILLDNIYKKDIKTDNYNISENTTADGKNVQIADVIKDADGNVSVKTTEGETIKAEDMSFTKADASLVEAATKYSPRIRADFIANYNGQNINDYITNFDLAYAAGQMGVHDALSNIDNSVIDETSADKIYLAAKEEKTARINDVIKAGEKLDAKWEGKLPSGTFMDKEVNVDGKTYNLKQTDLSRTERVLYAMYKNFSKLGLNVAVFKDKSSTSKNGMYDSTTNTLYFNLAARATTGEYWSSDRRYVINTTAHELTHWLEVNNAEAYSYIEAAYIRAVGEARYNQRVAYHTKKGLSDAAARSEVIARACEDMLTDPNTMHEILSTLDETKLEKVKNAILDFFDSVKDFFADMFKTYNGSIAEEARMLRENAEAYEEIRRIWADGFTSVINGINVAENLAEAAEEGTQQQTEAALKEAVKETFEEKPYTNKEVRDNEGPLESIKFDDDLMDAATKFNDAETKRRVAKGLKALVTGATLQNAKQNRQLIKKALKEFEYLLPADIEEDGKKSGSVLVGNSSYGKSAEHSLICVRSLVNRYFIDMVSENLGRPMTVEEQLAASMTLSNVVGNLLQCRYCYVAADRASYNASLLRYYNSYESVLNYAKNERSTAQKEYDYIDKNFSKLKAAFKDKEGRKESFKKVAENLPGFTKYLNGRTVTADMLVNYAAALKEGLDGTQFVTAADLASEARIEEAMKDPAKKQFIANAVLYAKRASHAKGTFRIVDVNGKPTKLEYVAYNGSVLKMTPQAVAKLNEEFGLRLYSYSDYVPAFILEDMQIVTDAAVKGLKMLAYTKDLGFVNVFGDTGMGINVSVFAALDKSYKNDAELNRLREEYLKLKNENDANENKADTAAVIEARNAYLAALDKYVIADAMQGAGDEHGHNNEEVWEPVKFARRMHPHVGAVFVATDDDMVEWGLAQDWVDVVIPYHLVFAGDEIPGYFGWRQDYKSFQEDKKTSEWKKGDKKSIPPTIHGNDFGRYMKALEENHLTPRFAQFVKNPNYMKLVNETRVAYDKMNPVQPNFTMDAALDEIERLEKEGKYGLGQGLTSMDQQEAWLSESLETAISNVREGRIFLDENDQLVTKAEKEGTVLNSAKLDDEYMAAVESNDMEKAAKLVEEAARKAGYKKLLYHGTKHFGFTKFDLSKMDDGQSIFLTDDADVAKSYSGRYGTRRIYNEANKISLRKASHADIVEEYNRLFNSSYKVLDVTKAEEILNDKITKYKDDAELLRSLASEEFNKLVDNDKASEILIRYAEELEKFAKNPSETADDSMFALESVIRSNQKMAMALYSGLRTKLNTYASNQEILRFKKRIESKEKLAVGRYVDDIVTEKNMREEIKQQYKNNDADASGNYALYAKVENPITIDSDEMYWDEIEVDKALGKKLGIEAGIYKTRDIADAAKKSGYDSVIFKSLIDVGMEADDYFESDVYVVFNAAAVKSADPVTYDDAGNIIPLSERFNTENEDIRYSVKHNVNSKWLEMACEADIAKEKIEEGKFVYTRNGQIAVSLPIGVVYFGGTLNNLIPNRIVKIVDLNNNGTAKLPNDIKDFAQDTLMLMEETAYANPALYFRPNGIETAIKRTLRNVRNRTVEIVEYVGPVNNSFRENWRQSRGSRLKNEALLENDWLYGGVYDKELADAGSIPHQKLRELISWNTGVDAKYFSDKLDTSAYELLGENKRLEAENAKLAADIEKLKERIKLSKTLTHGKVLKQSQLEAAAKTLLKSANSTMALDEMVEGLKEVYGYILDNSSTEGAQVEWDELMSRAYDLATRVLAKQKGTKTVDTYYKDMLDTIRKTKIKLSDEQIAELKNRYGSDWRNNYFGRLMLTKNTPNSVYDAYEYLKGMYPGALDETFLNEMDMLDAIDELYNTARDLKDIVEYHKSTEDARYFAMEVYNKFWNIATEYTVADKQRAEANRLKNEHKRAINELKQSMENQMLADSMYFGKQIAQQKRENEELKKYHREVLKKVRDRKNNEIAAIKKHQQDMKAKQKEELLKRAAISKIYENAGTLMKWMNENSAKEHVPDVLKNPVRNLLEAIDFSSQQLLGLRGPAEKLGTETKRDRSIRKSLEAIRDIAAKSEAIQNGAEMTIEGINEIMYFPPQFADDLQKICDIVNTIEGNISGGQYIIQQMSVEQLEALSKVVTILKNTVTKMNRLISDRNDASVSSVAQQTIVETGELGLGKVNKVMDFLGWKNAVPYFAFKRMGEGAQKIFRLLQDGWDRFAFNVKEIKDFVSKLYDEEDVTRWANDIHSFDITRVNEAGETTTRTIQMTATQMMSLYCLSKREQAEGHIFGGGITIKDIKVKGKETIRQPKSVNLSHTEVENIIKELEKVDDGKAIEVAKELQRFMSEKGAEWGNYVTMKRFGINGFTEKYYFPIKSNPNNLPSQPRESTKSLYALLNLSFTKPLVNKATNAIELDNIFDVFTIHMSEMAKYNALALPVLDALKWLNYKENGAKAEDGSFETLSVKTALDEAFGAEAKKYITNFIQDLNGTQEAGRNESLPKKLVKNYKIAAVGLNFQVVALQPISIFRASYAIDDKYIRKGLAKKGDIEKAEKYCGIVLWKGMGFYDTNISKGLDTIIKSGGQYKRFSKEWIDDKSLAAAQKADEWTLGHLWNACEAEILDTTELAYDTEEFNNAVAERLREVIYNTQVVDSTMTRSDNMRSQSLMVQILTAFGSEPTLSLNMLADAATQFNQTLRKTGSKHEALRVAGPSIKKAAMAYLVCSVVESIIRGVIGKVRDLGDEDKEDKEIYKRIAEQFVQELNVLNKIPILKDIMSQMQGYSSNRIEVEFARNGILAYQSLMKNGLWDYKTIYRTATAVGQLSGNAFGSVVRDMSALWNLTVGLMYPEWQIKK